MKESRIYTCSDCDKVYCSKRDLRNHLNSKHLKLKPFKCDQCPAAFTARPSLGYHIKTKHENQYEEHLCNQCAKTFKQNSALQVNCKKKTIY